VLAISKAIGMGKDFVMQQRENLDDLVAEAKETEAQAASAPSAPSAPAAPAEPSPDAQA
jgi:ribosomal protein L12E/L44/L45/RPP1/RPP2